MEAACILFNTGRETAHSEDEESEKGLKGMKLKKWLTGVLAAAMALSLAACGKKDDGKNNADAPADSLALAVRTASPLDLPRSVLRASGALPTPTTSRLPRRPPA